MGSETIPVNFFVPSYQFILHFELMLYPGIVLNGVVRFLNAEKREQPFQFDWDCHSISVESPASEENSQSQANKNSWSH